jgi:hypothetical protein
VSESIWCCPIIELAVAGNARIVITNHCQEVVHIDERTDEKHVADVKTKIAIASRANGADERIDVFEACGCLPNRDGSHLIRQMTEPISMGIAYDRDIRRLKTGLHPPTILIFYYYC